MIAWNVPTFGVEEEFLLIDPVTYEPVSEGASNVADLLIEPSKSRYRTEFYSCIVEMATDVCVTTEELSEQLTKSRIDSSAAAVSLGKRLISSGISPVGGSVRITRDVERYRGILARFGYISSRGFMGQHTHVAVESKEMAIQVCNHIRPWLPILQAISSNSPFAGGEDTRYASWRAVLWNMWPIAGPPPHLNNLDEYHEYIRRSISTGIILEGGSVYWHSRPSKKYPTVEIRIADACQSVADSVLMAALIRGLVASLVRDIEAGYDPYRVEDFMLSAAHWRAARFGLTDTLVDLSAERLVPAEEAVEALFYKSARALSDFGDFDLVRNGLDRILADGTGSERQRRAFEDGGMSGLIDLLDVDRVGA